MWATAYRPHTTMLVPDAAPVTPGQETEPGLIVNRMFESILLQRRVCELRCLASRSDLAPPGSGGRLPRRRIRRVRADPGQLRHHRGLVHTAPIHITCIRQLATDGVEDDPEAFSFWKIKHGIRWTGMPSGKGAFCSSMLRDRAPRPLRFIGQST